LRDPRSQKLDLGHPSISPFDIAEGTSFVISLPTRLSESAAPRDDKGKGGASMARCGTAEAVPFVRSFSAAWLYQRQSSLACRP
jgi:hypothetical protein